MDAIEICLHAQYYEAMSNSTGPTRLAVAVAAARRATGLNQVELARIAGVAQSIVSAAETGARRPPWSLIDALGDELRELGKPDEASALRDLRSRSEAPGLGEPGTLALCLGATGDAHWVRRKPGQVFCEEDGSHLIGRCPTLHCEFEFRLASDRARYCAGCGTPITALFEAMEEPEFVRSAERLRREDHDAVVEMEGEDIVSAPELLGSAERIRRHNEGIGKSALDPRSREGRHYSVARSLAEDPGGAFSRKAFLERYMEQYGGPENTVLPSEFRVGNRSQGRRQPWFLVKRARGYYEFVGLDGQGDGIRTAAGGPAAA